MNRLRMLLASVFVAVLSLGLAACTKKIDADKLEKNIHDELKSQTGVEPTEVSCPDDVEEKKGETFTCTATAPDGSEATVVVTMKGDGNVEWEVKAGATPPSGGGGGAM